MNLNMSTYCSTENRDQCQQICTLTMKPTCVAIPYSNLMSLLVHLVAITQHGSCSNVDTTI